MYRSQMQPVDSKIIQPKVKVLMVDDEAAYVRLAKLSLEAEGDYEVQTVCRAVEAVQAALDFRPVIILLDVMMPGRDGGDVAASMQNHAELRSIPIIFVTAAIKRTESIRRYGRIGGRRVLAKPVPIKEIVQAIGEELAD